MNAARVSDTAIRLRPTGEDDLDWVVALEHAPDNARNITRWPRPLHAAVAAREDARHFIIADDADNRLGYVILRIDALNASVELLRIVVERPGAGTGRAALRRIVRMAFEELAAHRLWLDVVTDNEGARRLYRSEGFVEEGMLREAALRPDGFASLVIMSMLDHEYHALHHTQPHDTNDVA